MYKKCKDSIMETTEVKCKGSYDVIVAGGGISGCAAAIAARRKNRTVLLVEKTISLGGLATNGLVVFYNPSLCDRRGRKIIGGISEELLHASVKYGSSTLGSEWKFRTDSVASGKLYQTQFSAASFVTALDELIEATGINILFDTICCKTIMDNGVCKGIIMENKEGRVYYECNQLIDTTGDLDLFKRSGVPCIDDLNWLSFWAFSLNLEKMKNCCENNDIQNILDVKTLGADRDGVDNPIEARRYNIDTGEEVSEFITKGRRYLLEYLKKMDFKSEMIVQIPAQAQFRTTRYVVANYTLDKKDKNLFHNDSVGCVYTDREGGFFIEVPYQSMVVHGFKNMITAGRTISSVGIVRELTRLIAPCAMTGEAAGIAASLAIELGCDINDVPIDRLQQEIITSKGIVHF